MVSVQFFVVIINGYNFYTYLSNSFSFLNDWILLLSYVLFINLLSIFQD